MTLLNTTNNAVMFHTWTRKKINHSFNIKGVDHAGRIGSNSQSVYLVFDEMKILLMSI